MNHVLKYDPLGIDEHDVQSCVDVKLLQHWKSEIDQDTRPVSYTHLDVYKRQRHYERKYNLHSRQPTETNVMPLPW